MDLKEFADDIISITPLHTIDSTMFEFNGNPIKIWIDEEEAEIVATLDASNEEITRRKFI